MIRISAFLILFSICMLNASYGQFPILVKDINTNLGEDGDPTGFVKLGAKFYFFATDATHGNELWVSDGTGAGTHIVKDINPTSEQPKGTVAIVVSNTLFFVADDGDHGFELWKSDGTDAGTVLVKDINPGANDAFFSNGGLVDLNGVLYFVADDGVNGSELWKSDGTSAGTVLVKDVSNGALSGFLDENLYVFNNAIYFAGIDDTNGEELWKSDGTTAGTAILKDINPGSSESNPFGFYGYNNVLYFQAMDWEIWKTDGTSAGTELLKSFGSGTNGNFIGVNSIVFFAAEDATNGNELWKTDGTPAGTVLVKDIAVGVNSSSPLNKDTYISFNNKLYFEAADASGDYELWVSDGTDAGTQLLKNINPTGSSFPNNFIIFNSMIFFSADDGSHGFEIWKSDGTTQGTELVADVNQGPTDFAPTSFFVFDNTLFANADGGQGFELWELSPLVNPSAIINPASKISSLHVYPNPATSTISIDLKDTKENVSLFIYNSFGIKVKEVNIVEGSDNATIDISELVQGVYYINVGVNEGAVKIVKN